MRALCMDNSNPRQPELLQPGDWSQKGEVYTVIGDDVDICLVKVYVATKYQFVKVLSGNDGARSVSNLKARRLEIFSLLWMSFFVKGEAPAKEY